MREYGLCICDGILIEEHPAFFALQNLNSMDLKRISGLYGIIILYVITGHVEYMEQLTMVSYSKATNDAFVIAFVTNLETEHNMIENC
jgi:hypothetical protein